MSTTTADIEAIVRRSMEAFNAGNEETLKSFIADDAVQIDVASGMVMHGKQGGVEYQRHWKAAFPDARTEIDSITIEGNRAAIEFRGVGTHTGTFHTPMGEIPPT